jgi:hypothetical protein
MEKSNLITGAVMSIFGLFTLLYIIPTQTSEAGDATISPALLPEICALSISILGALLAIMSLNQLRAGATSDESPIKRDDLISAVFVLLAIGFSSAVFILVNPALASLILVLSLMLYMGERRLPLLVAIPTTLTLAGYLLLYEVLGMTIA